MKIVSAYYDIPSKQPNAFYFEHIARFFKFIDIPIIFFTDSKNLEILKPLAKSNVQFHIQEFHELSIFKDFPPEFWQEQLKNDPEKYHTWQLGAIWANKSRFVRDAMNIYETEWYMWVDAGSLRQEWPGIEYFGKRALPEVHGVYVQLLRSIVNKQFFAYPEYYIAGSHILFHKEYVNTFVSLYDKTLKIYEKEKISLISDQYIMASMVSSNSFPYPVLLNVQTPDNWFFFYSVF
jgi:hypothetical protein